MVLQEIQRSNFGAANSFEHVWHLFLDGKVAAKNDPKFVIKVHRIILSAVSQVFRLKFEAQPEPNCVVKIDLIDYDTLNAIIQFIYKGKVKVAEEEVDAFFTGLRMLGCRFNDEAIDGRIHLESRAGNSASKRVLNRFEIRNIKQEQYNGQDHGMDEQVPITHVAPNQPQPYLSNGPASPILPPGLNNVSETNRDFKGLLQVSVHSSGTKQVTKRKSEESRSVDPILSLRTNKTSSRISSGPHGYYWLRSINPLDTTGFAVQDKFENHFFESGNYRKGEELFVAFNSQNEAQTTLDKLKQLEGSSTTVSSVVEVPDHVVTKLQDLEAKRQRVDNFMADQPASEIPPKYLILANIPMMDNAQISVVNILTHFKAFGYDKLTIQFDHTRNEARVQFYNVHGLQKAFQEINGQQYQGQMLIARIY